MHTEMCGQQNNKNIDTCIKISIKEIKKNSKKFLIFYYDLNNRPVQEYWLHVHIISDSEIL